MSDQAFFLRGATSCLKLSILNSCIRAAAVKIANIPRSHYDGSKGENIGRYVAENFCTKGGRYNCIKIEIVKVTNPSKEWVEIWSEVISLDILSYR